MRENSPTSSRALPGYACSLDNHCNLQYELGKSMQNAMQELDQNSGLADGQTKQEELGGLAKPPEGAGGGGAIAPEIIGAVNRATEQTIAEHNEQPKWRPKGRPRKSPLAPVVGGLEVPVGLQASAPPPPVVVDEESLRILVDGAIDMVNDFASSLFEQIALKHKLVDDVAKKIGAAVVMKEKTQAAIRLGAIGVIKKYSPNLAYAPEICLGLGMTIWSLQLWSVYRSIKPQNEKEKDESTH